jgi:hypothetical protein
MQAALDFYRHLYADKEKFVTAASCCKMEEMVEQEKEQARADAMEAALDVTKQKCTAFAAQLLNSFQKLANSFVGD